MHQNQIQWATDVLTNLNYKIQTEQPTTIQDNAWSYVCRFDTNQGAFFLKVTPTALFIEAQIINKLDADFQFVHIRLSLPKFAHFYILKFAYNLQREFDFSIIFLK